MTSSTGAGSPLRSRLLPPSPLGRMPRRAKPSADSSLTRVASTDPSTDTPIAPPKVRKKATLLEAAPMFCTLTVFCTASTRFCIIMPMPRPITVM
ncbi:Uncharacterised protein [Mycobacteroides abscessus subsp. abscessus]|nr:Uncharacterised protein [Mycobacteroides abscessus subsp. abscessus]